MLTQKSAQTQLKIHDLLYKLDCAAKLSGALELDPRIVDGWVDMCLGALKVLVTAKRGKHSDDKAIGQTVEEHLDHADIHMSNAYGAVLGDLLDGDCDNCGTDDDGLLHIDHATARVALVYTRMKIVAQEKSKDAFRAATGVGEVDLTAGIESASKFAARFYIDRRHPNSCKVDKLEHGRPIGRVSDTTRGLADAYAYGPLASIWPTRKLDTDCKPGKTPEACQSKAKSPWGCDTTLSRCINGSSGDTWSQTWTIYGNDKPVTTATNVKAETNPVGVALDSARKGNVVYVAIGRPGYITAQDLHDRKKHATLCNGCSYAKWPHGGPGYSERCDACKLSANRPGYQPR